METVKHNATTQVPTSRSSLPRVAILVDTSTSWGRRIITGINHYTRQHGAWQTFVEARGMDEPLQVPEGWEGEGVIARVGTLEMAKALRRLRLPVVNISGIQLPGVTFPQVTTDMDAAGKLAASHFLERGFRHFAYFSLLGLAYVSAQQDAYVRAVKAARCCCAVYGVEAHHGAEPDWTVDVAKIGAWLKSLPKPVAVFTWNASSGREIVRACDWAGLHVPEEVALLSGADDDLLCELTHIPISGLHVATEQVGFHAASVLAQLMQGHSAPATPKFFSPLGVVVRRSTDTLAIQDQALVKALNFIRTHANQPIQVRDVAQHAGVSRRVLERRFAQVLGRSPAGEIRRVHLERAKQLLAETDLSIPDVAETSGFGSPEYMAYVFRAQLHKTPLKYRKEISGQPV